MRVGSRGPRVHEGGRGCRPPLCPCSPFIKRIVSKEVKKLGVVLVHQRLQVPGCGGQHAAGNAEVRCVGGWVGGMGWDGNVSRTSIDVA